MADRHSRARLIARADLIRPGATGRLITDWVSLGLLDRPYKPGRGRGAGSVPGTWSESQLHLFLNLWRQRPSASIVQLSNIPVYLWLFWGDDYVPLRQVRRAMRTWVERLRRVSIGSADAAANHLIHVFGQERENRAQRELLAEALREQKPDVEEVRAQLAKQLGSATVIRVPGFTRAVEIDDRVISGMLRGRLEAEDRLESLPDHLFHWARFFSLFGESVYAGDQPALASDQQRGWLFPKRHHDQLALQACANLVTLLGASLKTKIDPKNKGTLLDPVVWQEHGLLGVIRRTEISERGLFVDFEIGQSAERPSVRKVRSATTADLT